MRLLSDLQIFSESKAMIGQVSRLRAPEWTPPNGPGLDTWGNELRMTFIGLHSTAESYSIE